MIRHDLENVSFLQFELLQQFPKLKHAIFLKKHQLNFKNSLNTDICKLALQNENLSFIKAMGSHGAEVNEASDHFQTYNCDGISTNRTENALLNTHADCQIALFYDPIKHCVANIHSGWRGSVQNIYKNAVQHMKKQYGSKPENVFVGISPSLGPENAQFIDYRNELPETFWVYQSKREHFDFWKISEGQLIDCGILQEHIQIAGICTYEASEDFYSYRKTKTSERNATIVTLL